MKKNYYQVNLKKSQTHIAQVKLKFEINKLEKIYIQMPIWTPGSYKVREFSRHISNEKVSIDGEKRNINRIDKCTWQVDNSNFGKTIEFEYEVYAHEMTVRTSFLDNSQAILNGASIFVYCPDTKDNNIEVEILFPESWKNIVTGLDFDNEAKLIFAKNYDELIDSPIFIGNADIHNFNIDDKLHQFAIVGKGNHSTEKIMQDTNIIISGIRDIFGELPYDKYVFIAHLYDNQFGGLEHLNSCHIIFDRWQFKDRKKYTRFISLVAHEYFHTFNVKRIRPKELGPFNYQKEVYSEMLWLAEGVTSYYDEYILKRTGIIDKNEYFEMLSSNFSRYFSIPGRSVLSTKGASFLAWIKLYIPDENSINSTISYYLSGGLIALVMDLKIRELTSSERSLDDVFKILWKKFKEDGKGISEVEFFKICKNVCSDDLEDIKSYLNKPKEIDFASAFKPFGIEFVQEYNQEKEESNSWLGVKFNASNKLIIQSIESNGPSYLEFLSPGDELIAVNQSRITELNRDQILSSLSTKIKSEFLINRMGDILKIKIKPEKQPYNKFKLIEVKNPSKTQIKLYENWLNSKWEK